LTYNAHFYVLAFVFLTLGISVALVVWGRKKSSMLDLTVGATLFWWLLALVTSIVFPGMSYLFTWPVIAMSLAMGWVALKGKNSVALTMGALPGIILITPAIYVAYQFVLAPMIGVLVFFLALLLGLLGPQIELLSGPKPRPVTLGLLAVSAALLVVGSLTAGFTPDHPRPNAVAYLLEADGGEATWIQAGTVTDAWTEQFLSGEPTFARLGSLFPIERSSRFPVVQGRAASVQLPAPDFQILEDTTDGDTRTLHVRLISARSAPVIELDIAPYQAVIAVTLDGKRYATSESNRDLWTLIYYGVPAEGIELVLEVDANEPLSVQVIDSTWDLLLEVIEDSGVTYSERTSAMMRMPNFDYGTVVASTFDIR
jgi:hypothetical protein